MIRPCPLLVSLLVVGCSTKELLLSPANPDAADGAAGVGSGGSSAEATVSGAGDAGFGGQVTGAASSGVCGFAAPVTYGATGADGLVDVPPNEPNIFYMGRVDCRPEGPSFALPAVSVRLRFQGDALDLRLRDSGTGTATSTNYYDVSIDGGAATLLEVAPGDQVYPLARGLSGPEHTAEIVKRVESNGNTGKGQLLGFRLREGARLLPTLAKPLRVEFVGDSITCGYGNEVSTTTPDLFHYTTRSSNANLAYGAIVARRLDAEYVAVAASGRGVYRNYSDGAGELMPAVYDETLPDDSAAPAWHYARYTPDVVVVNLGTNDFSPPGPDHEAFKAAYTSFLAKLRGHYPSALLLAVVGPMISDGFPAGVMAWTTIQSDVSAVVGELTAQGDQNVHYLALTPQTSPYGEDWHPTVATHQLMADAVTAEITRLLARPE